MPKPKTEETLDSLLEQAEKEVTKTEVSSSEADRAVIREIEAIEAGTAATELTIERDLLLQETDLARKIEAELWNGAHIACLPYFYERYTVQAQIEPELQAKYNKATIAACSRFKALGERGLAMVSPAIDFIRNYASYTPADKQELQNRMSGRILAWLRLDILPEAKPRPPALARSLEQVVADIAEAEEVFVRSSPEAVYMEGEGRLAALKAIRSSMFLPGLVKIRLLEGLKTMPEAEIWDIGTFLLWEIRKSSHHRNLLLHTMLRLLHELNSSLI